MEGFLQIELIAYVPVAESPASVAAILFSASHFIMIVVAVVFFLTHNKGRVPTFFLPSPSVSEAGASEQGQGLHRLSRSASALARRWRATTTLMSLERDQLSESVSSKKRRAKEPCGGHD